MATFYVASGRTLNHRGHITWIAGQPVDDDDQSIIGAENVARLVANGTLTRQQDALSDEESRRLIAQRGGAA